MGLFSSRKTDEVDAYLTSTTGTNSDKSVVHTIRSKIYSKYKGKERDEPPASFYANASAAQTLSSSGPVHVSTSFKPTIVQRGAGLSILSIPQDESSTSKKPIHPGSNMGSPASPASSLRSRAGPSGLRHQTSELPPPLPPKLRQTADTISLTLAQRLNELAVANSEGLLNDDEYRLLRQNLFERFATSTAVPTEASVVPVLRPGASGMGLAGEGKPLPRPLSNFQVEINRSPSIQSKTSVTSGVASIFRRASKRRTEGGSKDYSETSSVTSSTSRTSNFFKRGLSRKSSSSSIRTTTSRIQIDAISISSRQAGNASERSPVERPLHFSPLASRSNASIRKLATPPSSFPSRIIGNDSSRLLSHSSDCPEDEHAKSASEIRQEIMAVETEARRLMDAFNGLEMTTLAKIQRHQSRAQLHDSGKSVGSSSSWSISHDGQSQKRVMIVDSDVASTKSATSTGTTPSMIRSPLSVRKARVKGGNTLVSPGSSGNSPVKRMNSTSSLGSQERKGVQHIPPVPTLPSTHGHLAVSGSNISLTRINGQPSTIAVLGEDLLSGIEGNVENEMDDIRRRREEVSARYEVRLEYLRAKLKGAELHEKARR